MNKSELIIEQNLYNLNKRVLEQEQNWDIQISTSNPLFNLHLKDVWNYRDLLVLLVRRDFVSFYKQTILGPLWFFLQPLFTTLMFTFVFGQIGGFSTDQLPQPLFYMAGITAWNYFSDCLNKTSSVFATNASLFGKVYFPRLIVPLSNIASNLVRFAVQIVLFLLVMAVYALKGAHFHLTWAIVLFPILVVLMGLLGLGVGMVISSLTTKYRDLSFLFGFAVQLLMYATTVIYPLSSAPGKYRFLIEANPMTPILEAFRYGFLGKGDFTWFTLAYSTCVTIIFLLAGLLIFNKVERNFIDTV